MKILMSLIICSSVAGECMPPFEWPEVFRSKYDFHVTTQDAKVWASKIYKHLP